MGSLIFPLQRDFSVDSTTEWSDSLPLVVNCVNGILCLVTSILFGFINLTFNFFCSFIFKSFKLIYIMFQVLETLFAFSKSLIQFNYTLVSRGLVVLGEIASQSSACLQIGCVVLFKFLFNFFNFIVNISYLCLELTVYLVTVSKDLVLLSLDRVICSCSAGYSSFVAWVGYFLTLFAQYAWSFVTIFIHVVKTSFSIFGQILAISFNQTTSFAEQFIHGLLIPSLHATGSIMVASFQSMGHFLNSAGQKFIGLISESTSQIFIICEQLGEWIAMPFTLSNLKVILQSVFMLLKNIISLLIFAVSFVFGLTKNCLVTMLEQLAVTFQYLSVFFKGFGSASFWIMLILLACFAIPLLAKNGYLLHRLSALVQGVYRTLSSIFQRQNIGQNEQRRLGHEANGPAEERLLRHEVEVTERMDEQPPAGGTNAQPVTAGQAGEENELTICIICQDVQRSTVLLPCRHLCLCKDCAKTLHSHIDRAKRRCPLCRKCITDIMDVYI